MKGTIQMKLQTTITKLLPALALAAIFSLCGATVAQATPEPHLRTGMFGVARGQIARINAVNIGNPNDRPVRPIEIEMMFLDEMGVIVGRDVKTIAPGEAAFFDVMFDPTREETRVQLRAVVAGLGGPDTRDLRATVEVFDGDSGKNTVFVQDSED
jgi:hypothetical protein